MSVITARALPDVRDGLKPVHRRILWGMHDIGARPDRSWMKCARVTGDVMGRYHPHGDGAIYDALVRMAQDFSLRHPLVAGHGNFGSPDFGPAASRYTECRLAPLAMVMLQDIDEETVDFIDNYSGEFQQPVVLPARFPNLLVNGSQGIAVGMATNIPPHNLGEAIDAVVHLIDNPDATPDDLMAVRQGARLPDGRPHHGPLRHHRRLPHRQGIDPGAGACRDRRGHRPPARPHRRHRDAVPGVDLGHRGQDQGPGRVPPDRGHRRRQRRVGGRQDPARHRAEEGRAGARHPQQPVQAHAAADELRRQHGGAGRRRAPHPQPRADAAGVRRSPGRGHPAAKPVPPGQEEGAGPPGRGPPQGDQRHRRGHRPHPGLGGPCRGPHRPDGRALRVLARPGRAHPRHAARAAHPAGPHRPRVRAGEVARATSPTWRPSWPTRAGCSR